MALKKITVSQPKVDVPDTEWQAIIGQFLERINPSRVKAGYKELTAPRLAKMLSDAGYNNTTAIRDLFKECDQAKVFGALLNYKLKK